MKRYFIALMGLFAVVFQSIVFAEDTGFRVKTGYSNGNYSSDFPGSSGQSIKASFQLLNLGLAYVDPGTGLFLDVTTRKSVGNNTWSISPATDYWYFDSTRKENSVTFGKIFTGGYNLFAGYLKTDSTFNRPYLNNNVQIFLNIDIKFHGAFVGGGWSTPLGPGVASVSASIARMAADLTGGNSQNNVTSTLNFGTGTGGSIAGSYSFPLSRSLTLVPEYKYQRFKPSGYVVADVFNQFSLNLVAKF